MQVFVLLAVFAPLGNADVFVGGHLSYHCSVGERHYRPLESKKANGI